ncbi:hypothetical protein ASPFODRAFT_330899 [Aspergillus luchuensis CBS 106.47]|uniref:Uncharacterized protein n=1 Tax=Aspergillus luchuensis (strain CBS 106.47) TaxID=1137211 RepID=A0A1M3T7J1_ASPLC|nr:hypothetical protein ASPFODRAFT_330899 [Aspergillus luchuensis CBS 106.47]
MPLRPGLYRIQPTRGSTQVLRVSHPGKEGLLHAETSKQNEWFAVFGAAFPLRLLCQRFFFFSFLLFLPPPLFFLPDIHGPLLPTLHLPLSVSIIASSFPCLP